MKTLGLLGGLSWQSTELYYRLLNQRVAEKLGGLHSAKLLIYSFDFDGIAALQHAENWPEAGAQMVKAALKLKAGGAEAIVICTNTMHMFAADIEAATGLPVMHIGDAVAHELAAQNITQAGILGTYFTMSMDFYADYYRTKHGITLIAPDEADKHRISTIIYNELCKGIASDDSRKHYITVMESLRQAGAQAIILGCTEICLLINAAHFPSLPILNSTKLHAEYAVDFALS